MEIEKQNAKKEEIEPDEEERQKQMKMMRKAFHMVCDRKQVSHLQDLL